MVMAKEAVFLVAHVSSGASIALGTEQILNKKCT